MLDPIVYTIRVPAPQFSLDGTISFITIVPGFNGLEFVGGDKTRTLRDAQHEYVYKAG